MMFKRFVIKWMKNPRRSTGWAILLSVAILFGNTCAFAVQETRILDNVFTSTEYDSLITLDPKPAKAVTGDSDEWPYIFAIDKGTTDGIFLNMIVITETGLVGNICEVEEYSAKVRTIIDPGNVMACMVDRTREIGLLTAGEVESLDEFFMLYLPPECDAMLGDTIITSGMDSLYPKGIKVGCVIEDTMEESDDNLVIRLSANFTHIEDVLVLRGFCE